MSSCWTTAYEENLGNLYVMNQLLPRGCRVNGRFFYCISGVLLKAQNQRKGLRAAGRNAEHIGGLEDLRVFIDWARILPSLPPLPPPKAGRKICCSYFLLLETSYGFPRSTTRWTATPSQYGMHWSEWGWSSLTRCQTPSTAGWTREEYWTQSNLY